MAQEEAVQANKLYVGNLPYSATDSELSQLFGEVGKVESASIINDKFSGRSKGFGFIEMSTAEEAQAAIEKFNGYEMDGRKLIVNVARPLRPREDRGGFQPRR